MSVQKKALPIGISDFSELITKDYYYVDKSLFIQELVLNKEKVTLIPRPRRFGKTLNMSMLKYFFEKTEVSNCCLFDHLAISEFSDIMTHQGQYPVIFMSLKGAVGVTWESSLTRLKKIVSDEFRRHKYLLEAGILDVAQMQEYRAIMDKTAHADVYGHSLLDLSRYLQEAHQQPVKIFIDEYDALVHAAYLNNFYQPAIDFLRAFLGDALKENLALESAVLTGILRVAKESIFSGLNNLSVETVLGNFYADKFGFLEHDVAHMLDNYDVMIDIEEVRLWYDSYQSGQYRVYNPWSVLNLLKNKTIKSYWVHTAQEDIIKQLIDPGSLEQQADVNTLMDGGVIRKKIDENIVFEQLKTDPDVLWGLLLFTGYLTFTSAVQETSGFYVTLTIPNREILTVYFSSVYQWFKRKLDFSKYEYMLRRLALGEVDRFIDLFKVFVLRTLSVFDVQGDEPERFYHALVLGMLAVLYETHEIVSNRESGLGRFDVMLVPKDHTLPGVIIEFKKVDSRASGALELAAQKALEQITEKRYAIGLQGRGITRVIELAIVFRGKEVLIKENL